MGIEKHSTIFCGKAMGFPNRRYPVVVDYIRLARGPILRSSPEPESLPPQRVSITKLSRAKVPCMEE